MEATAPTMPNVAGSHVVEPISDTHVVIRDLELFVGYDPDLDGDDERFTKWTDKRIREVIDRTQAYMAKGQHPKLILGHNVDGTDAYPKPTIGDIQTVKYTRIGGTPGIVGDVVMRRDHFDAYIASNEYPRRSAEIWLQNNHLSEVALLGSETPARPLPDTRFAQDGERERFSRVFAAQFAECEDSAMDDPKKDDSMGDDPKDLDDAMKLIKSLRAKLKAMEDDKSKNADDGDDDEKAKNAAVTEANERAETFKRERDETADKFERLTADLASVQRELATTKFSAQMAEAEAKGTTFGDAEQRSQILERIVTADDPDAELAFYTKVAKRDPIGIQPVEGTRVGGADHNTMSIDDRTAASERARDRALADGKPGQFSKYLAEERNAG
jgi:hypothetical protein